MVKSEKKTKCTQPSYIPPACRAVALRNEGVLCNSDLEDMNPDGNEWNWD